MGYMGFGMQKWIYTQKPKKYQEYQSDNEGHEILGYKNHKNADPELIEEELKSINARIEEAKKAASLSLPVRIIFGVLLLIGVAALIFFTQKG